MYNSIKDVPLTKLVNQGCIDICIDKIVPCLIDTVDKSLKETFVFKIESRSFLKKFTTNNGWKINWIDIPKDIEVYALALKENNEIQGLVALKNDKVSRAVYLHWMCTAPHNNINDYGNQRYVGVGGHLFAIAADKSAEWGYEGVMHGYALNEKLLQHYMDSFGALYLGIQHKFQFVIEESQAKKLMEVYTYEWH